MNRIFKIILSGLFVMTVAVFVARSCWHIEFKVTPKKQVAKVPVKKKTVKPVTKARMAIILDDWGYDLSLVDDAEAVGKPVTLSILPHLPHSADIAEAAHDAGLGVMLHLPMQAKNRKAAVEPHTIRTDATDAQILDTLDKALASVPHVEGVNNHQGSAATSDLRVMRTVLYELKRRGLFFVDSHVIASTVGGKVAQEVGIPFTRRDVFIDNQATVEAVKTQLREAQRIALSRGRVIVIGHDKRPTLQAIKEMVPELEKNGVKLVLVKDVLE